MLELMLVFFNTFKFPVQPLPVPQNLVLNVDLTDTNVDNTTINATELL